MIIVYTQIIITVIHTTWQKEFHELGHTMTKFNAEPIKHRITQKPMALTRNLKMINLHLLLQLIKTSMHRIHIQDNNHQQCMRTIVFTSHSYVGTIQKQMNATLCMDIWYWVCAQLQHQRFATFAELQIGTFYNDVYVCLNVKYSL